MQKANQIHAIQNIKVKMNHRTKAKSETIKILEETEDKIFVIFV